MTPKKPSEKARNPEQNLDLTEDIEYLDKHINQKMIMDFM